MSPNKLKIQERIGKLKEYIEILKSYKHFSRQQIEEDKTIRGAVERYLYLAADISVSIAQMVIAERKLKQPSTYRDVIEILGEAGVLPKEFVSEFADMTGLRNILAHEYVKVDYDIVYDVIQNKLDQFDQFISYIEGFLKAI